MRSGRSWQTPCSNGSIRNSPMLWTEAQYQTYLAKQGQMDPAVAESTLLAQVRRCALQHGWLLYHTHDSRRSAEGFPDVVLVQPGHPVLFWELKNATRKPSKEQQTWLAFLARAEGVEAALFRPKDWPLMQQILCRRR